jgi:WD40 repeat protein
VRTWLFAEEKALKVLDHGHRVKIRAMDVLHAEAASLVVTGADDGGLRAWRTKRNEGEEEHSALEWKVEKAHKHQVLVVALYAPLPDPDGYFAEHVNAHWPKHLSSPLVLSASRNGYVRVCSLRDGKEVVPAFRAHDKAVTSLFACPGARRTLFRKSLDPFLVTASEDNTVKLWSMADFSLLRVLEGHEFDVTSVCVYMPKPPTKQWDASPAARGSNPTSRQQTPRLGSVKAGGGGEPSPSGVDAPLTEAGFELADCDPIVVSGGMDQTVRLWRYSSGECLKTQSDADSHITCVTCLDIEQGGGHTKHVGPVVCAGDGYGIVWVWSLALPYSLLYKLQGHTDEVRSVFAYDAEGLHPVLVSGSLDCTVKVWNLDSMKLLKTVEGHTADVSEVRVFNLGGSDLALVSASVDCTVRVVFDFMEAAPQQDVVKQLFEFDLNGTNAHVTADESSAFPRIAQLSRKEGAEQFFGTYYFLFAEALRRGRPDFLEEFLPLSLPGLLRSNVSEGDGEGGSLLRAALEKRDLKAIRCIVDCWCKFHGDAPSDYIHDEQLGRLTMPDLLLLAETVPLEFQKLVCSIKLVPVKGNALPAGSYFLYERDSDKAMLMNRTALPTDGKAKSKQVFPAVDAALVPTVAVPPTGEVSQMVAAGSDALSEHQYMYLPLTNAVHMDMLYAYTTTCEELDSVDIFNSDVGRLALAYAWRRMGLRVHLLKMAVYFVYIILSTASLLTFVVNKSRPGTGWISYALIYAQLALDAYFIKEEGLQLGVNPLEYLSDIWNAMDFVVVVTNVLANILRLSYDADTVATRILLCVCSIVGYFNILYFLRAFEETGPLVSMILKISQDMMYLIVVVLIVLVGFSQAFWILSEQHGDAPFGTIEASLLNSFVFMLGGYDPTAFHGIYLVRFAIALSAIYMLIVSILLLNLLIALMGDSYGAVKEKGLAQWKLEQAQIITEMQGSMPEQDRTCTSIVSATKLFIGVVLCVRSVCTA